MAEGSQADDDEPSFIIGIDFGTTFSGVSWAYSGNATDIEVISTWESKLNLNSDKEKAPTTLLFSGKHGNVSWGYGISPITEQEPLKWFKLLLVDENDLPKKVQKSYQIIAARKLVKEQNKDPVEVISEYLGRLWKHAIDRIVIQNGKEMVEMCRFHIVITLPAIWPDYAKARMQKAAESAGLLKKRSVDDTTLSFISEPEAAAIATMRDLKNKPHISVGDHIVVCDAGGGTVDLISYEIVSMEPFMIREAVQGDGGLCGGVFLDEAFVELIKKKVTPEVWNSLPQEEAKKLLNDDWENGIKTGFYGQNAEFSFGISAHSKAMGPFKSGIKRKKHLTLKCEDLLAVFNPVVDQTVDLVKKQIDSVFKKTGKKPKSIILVGGFGRCTYLRIRLKEAMANGIEILQGSGNKPWSAISRGAVIRGLTLRSLAPGLSVGISSRISRMSYGVKFKVSFDAQKHSPSDKQWCPVEHKWVAVNQMAWFLEKGTDVSIADPVRKEYYRLLESTSRNVSETIYSTSAWPPATSYNDTVKELCTISWSKKIDVKSLPRYNSLNGKVLGKLSYTIEMICAGASVDFTVVHRGKQVGARNVAVTFKTDEDY